MFSMTGDLITYLQSNNPVIPIRPDEMVRNFIGQAGICEMLSRQQYLY